MADETPAVGAEVSDQATGGSQEVQTDQATGSNESSVDITTIDPTTLAPELQVIHKSLLADYTQKTQGISEAQKKAETLDSLMSNEGISQMLENIEKYGTPYAPQQETQSEQKLSPDETVVKFLEDPEKFIQEAALKLVQPLRESEATREAQTVIDQLSSKYPDFMEHEDAIADLITRGVVTDPEVAYKVVTYEKATQKGADSATKVVEQRVKAAITNGSSATTAPADFKGWKDAFAAAKKQHGY